jgi:hypothetical protein
MDIETAIRVLGLQAEFTAAEVDAAKRRLLQALHPDKHPSSQAEIFQRMTQDVLEAAEVLAADAEARPRGRGGRPKGTTVEQTLYADIPREWKRAKSSGSKGIVKYDKTFTSDEVLAVAIHGIQKDFRWYNTSFGQRDDHSGSALYLTVLNRLKVRIESFYVGMHSLLVDDRGHQYSPADSEFYWSDEKGSWHRHTNTVAPKAKLDGFVLFPPLRKSSKCFKRWYLAGGFSVGDDYHDGEYDIELS